jgi:hypothetical protein
MEGSETHPTTFAISSGGRRGLECCASVIEGSRVASEAIFGEALIEI